MAGVALAPGQAGRVEEFQHLDRHVAADTGIVLESGGGEAVLARIGGERGFKPGEFYAPHCTWTDSEGSLYVGEVLEGQRIQKFVRK